MPELRDVLEEFEKISDELNELKEQKKEKQKEYDKLRYEKVPAALEEAGILDDEGKGSCTTPSGRKIYMRTDIWARIRKDNESVAHSAIKEMGYGDLLRETIHTSTLSAWIRERLEEAEPIPPGIDIDHVEQAVLRKS